MKQIFVARTVLACAALLAGVAAVAQDPGPPMGYGFGGHRPPMERALGPLGPQGRFWNDPAMIQKLSLTDDQRKSMDQILQQHLTTLVDLRGNVDKAEIAMGSLMHEDQPNESKILAQIDAVAQARAELEKANARFLLAVRAKLTPEQWKTLQAARAERMQQRHAQGFERNGGGPGQGGPGANPPQQ